MFSLGLNAQDYWYSGSMRVHSPTIRNRQLFLVELTKYQNSQLLDICPVYKSSNTYIRICPPKCFKFSVEKSHPIGNTGLFGVLSTCIQSQLILKGQVFPHLQNEDCYSMKL